MNRKKNNNIGITIALAVILILVIALGGCSSNRDSQENNTEKGSYSEEHSKNAAESSYAKNTSEENTSKAAQNNQLKEDKSDLETVQPASIRLTAVGDNLMHRSVSLSGQQADGSWNFARNFEHVAPIVAQSDIGVINQEAVMGGLGIGIQNFPTLNTGQEVAPYMVNAGFNVILGANNHILDQDYVGIKNMMDYWKTYFPDTFLLGIHESQKERDTIRVAEYNGIKVAMLNYTYDTNIHDALNDRPYLVDFLEQQQMTEDIKKAKQIADFIIVFPHWGEEYLFGDVTEEQRQLTQFFADQGVDLVIGAHPHVLEPVEWVERAGDNPMLVYYSLGNFQSIQYRTDTMLGGLASVTIVKDKTGTYISDHDLDFLVTHYQTINPNAGYFDYVTTYLLSEYTPELAAQHGICAEDASFSYDAIVNLSRQITAKIQ